MQYYLSLLLKTTFIFCWKLYHKCGRKIKVLWYRLQIKLNKQKILDTLNNRREAIDSTKKNIAEMLEKRASGIKKEYSSISEMPFIRKTHTGEIIWMNRKARRKLKK